MGATNLSTHPVILDTATVLKAAGLVAATANGSAKDIGTGLVDGQVVLDVTEVEVATGDESYQIIVQGSNASDFSSGVVNLARIHLGDSTVTGESADSVVGRYMLPFRNARDGLANYRYIRVRTVVAGTIATGINYTAYLTKMTHGT